MDYIGRYGEYRVLAKFFELKLEAYPAIKINQDDFDITVIVDNCQVVRVQVKTTTLWNESTNNSISGIEKKYDFVVIVIVEKNTTSTELNKNEEVHADEPLIEYIPHFFIMTRDEALKEKGTSKQIGVSRKVNGISIPKESLDKYRNAWKKISDFKRI